MPDSRNLCKILEKYFLERLMHFRPPLAVEAAVPAA